jgi:hypothetical protein
MVKLLCATEFRPVTVLALVSSPFVVVKLLVEGFALAS